MFLSEWVGCKMQMYMLVLFILLSVLAGSNVFANDSFIVTINSRVNNQDDRIPIELSAGTYELSAVPYSAWTVWSDHRHWMAYALVDTPGGTQSVGALGYFDTSDEANAAAVAAEKVLLTMDTHR